MRHWYLPLVFLLFCLNVFAEKPENTISFSKAREIILSQNSQIKAAISETEAARSGVLIADALPNPSVSLEMDNFGTNGLELVIEQTIELGGKRNLRKMLAHKQIDAQNNHRVISTLELDAEINRRFIPVTVISQKLQLLDSIILTVQATKEQIIKRVEAGASRKTDRLRVEIELEQLQLERDDMFRQLKQAKNSFAALGNIEDSTLHTVKGFLNDSLKVPSLEQLQEAYTKNPRLKTIDREIADLDLHKSLLKAEGVPDLDISLGYARNNEEKSNAAIMGLSMGIPLFNKNEDGLRQIDLQKQAVKQRLVNQNSILNAEIQNLHSKLLELDRKLEKLGSGTALKAQELYLTIKEYYQAGNASFFELMESQAELLQLQMKLIEIREERAHTFTDIMDITAMKFNIIQ